MRKLFNFLFCALLASPLAAFDISLDGVEFGKLQMTTTQSEWTLAPSERVEVLSETLTLHEGDVLQILRLSPERDVHGHRTYTYNHGHVGSSTAYFSSIVNIVSGGIVTDARSGYIVGPASIQVGYIMFNPEGSDRTENYSLDINNSNNAYVLKNNGFYAELDYAILRAGTSTQSSYVTIPANSSGNFEVKLQTSSDLQTWSSTTPGVFFCR